MFGFAFSYFIWHYTRALAELFVISRDFLWFVYHFFSISILSRSLLSPWQRLDERYKKGFRIGATLETFILNTLMRIVGFLIRSFVILVGLATLALVFVVEIAFFLSWILLPIIIAVLLVSGIRLMLK